MYTDVHLLTGCLRQNYTLRFPDKLHFNCKQGYPYLPNSNGFACLMLLETANSREGCPSRACLERKTVFEVWAVCNKSCGIVCHYQFFRILCIVDLFTGNFFRIPYFLYDCNRINSNRLDSGRKVGEIYQCCR